MTILARFGNFPSPCSVVFYFSKAASIKSRNFSLCSWRLSDISKLAWTQLYFEMKNVVWPFRLLLMVVLWSSGTAGNGGATQEPGQEFWGEEEKDLRAGPGQLGGNPAEAAHHPGTRTQPHRQRRFWAIESFLSSAGGSANLGAAREQAAGDLPTVESGAPAAGELQEVPGETGEGTAPLWHSTGLRLVGPREIS